MNSRPKNDFISVKISILESIASIPDTMDLKEKKLTILPILASSIASITSPEDLNALCKMIYEHPQLAFIKIHENNPQLFSKSSTATFTKITQMLFEKTCELFLKLAIPADQPKNTDTAIENAINRTHQETECLRQAQEATTFKFTHESLLRLVPHLPNTPEQKQRGELLLQTCYLFCEDASFAEVWHTLQSHAFKKLPLSLLLQNLNSILDNHQGPERILTLLYLLLAALTHFKLHNPSVDIATEAKYSGLGIIVKPIHSATSEEQLQQIEDLLKQCGFGYLRQHKHPFFDAIHSLFREKLTESWKAVNKSIEQKKTQIDSSTPVETSKFRPQSR